MTIPYVSNTILDGAGGALALGSELHVKIGAATSGDATFQIFTSPDDVETEYTSGPLCEAGSDFIANTGLPVALVRIASGAVTAGTLSAITKVGGHAGPTISNNSTAALDAYELLVEIVLGGAVATATFKYSLDGGDTWSATIVTAATVNLTGSGISLAFAVGTYVAGNQYSATTTAPTYTAQGLSDAIDVAFASASAFRMIHVIGHTADAADTATSAAAVQTIMNTKATSLHRYSYAMIEVADDSDADIATALTSVSANRIAATAGFVESVSTNTQRLYRRHAAWKMVEEVMRRPISVDAAYFADGYGAIQGVTEIERDERKTPLLDDARCCTLRTWVGRQGFYVTRGRMLATTGSDYTNITHRQVMDAACAIAYDALLNFSSADLLLDNTTGKLLEKEAQAIEAFVNGKLSAGITAPGHASDVQFTINRNWDVLTTEKIKCKTRILPKAYSRYIENEISFRNPALEAAQG
jgi:hypothetical protein